MLTNRFIACSRWIFRQDDARKIEARRIGVARRVLALFFWAMVRRWARAGTGFARGALDATITVCDPTDIVAAEDVNAEVCGCGALFLYVRLMRRRY